MAGTEVGSLHYTIDLDDKKLHRGLDDADSKMSKLGHTMAGLGKALAVGFAVVGAAAVAFGASSVKAFSESQDAAAQTNAVLKSTGSIAGVTAAQVTDLATSLQKVTKFSDEEIRSAENMLLTFTNISKDIFPETTKTVLDMSQALGQDLKTSSIQLGKALNNPIDGITALTRVGVKFTDAQKEQITKLVEAGKVMEAQKIILKELQTEFGGSAEAAGTTFAGRLAILKNSLNDVQETIGFVIVDALQPLASAMADFVNRVDWEAVVDRSTNALRNLWTNHLVPMAQAIANVAAQVGDYLIPKLSALWDTVQARLIPTLSRLWHEVIEPLAPVIGTVLVFAIGAAIDVLAIFINMWTSLVNVTLDAKSKIVVAWQAVVGAFNWARDSIAPVFEWIRQRIEDVKGWFSGLPGPIRTALAGVTDAIFGPFDEAFRAIKAGIQSVNKAMSTLNVSVSGGGGVKGFLGSALRSLVPGFATGVTNFSGGLAYVHQGEVLANLPQGTDVIPKSQAQGMKGSSVTVNIGTIQDRQDADYILQRLDRKQQLEDMGIATL